MDDVARLMRGYTTHRGGYRGTTDDRLDGWYICPVDGPHDHRGRGFIHRAYARQALREHLEALVAHGS